MGIVIGLSAVVSALATIVIGVFTALNFMIYKELQKKQEEQQQKFNDVLEGIVIASLISPNEGAYLSRKGMFLQEYKGKAQIFKGK